MNDEKFDKIIKYAEIIAILLAAVLLVVFKFIPELKADFGSSDTYINVDTYDTIVEINVLSGPNFFLITTEDKVTNILFMNETSCVLYNKDIENTDLTTAVTKITSILTSNSLVTQESKIQITAYPKNTNYEKVKQALTTTHQTIYIQETTKTLVDRVKELQISSSTEQNSLYELQLYSKDIVERYKKDNNNSSMISKTEAKQYADQVYSHLQKYSLTHPNQSIDDTSFPIQLIPITTTNATLYPSVNSWYYIENQNVYAYIAFDKSSYSFCYQGTQQNIKEGECR